MVNLKSLLLGVLAFLLFSIAFSALFLSLSLYLLPADFQDLRTTAEQQLPVRMLNSSILNRMVDQSLPLGNVSEAEFQTTLQAFRIQCTAAPSTQEPMASLCSDVQAGRIHSLDDVRLVMKERMIMPALRQALATAFDQMKTQVDKLVPFTAITAILFLFAFLLGGLIVAFQNGLFSDAWNGRAFIHEMANWVWGMAFFTFLPLLLIWAALPYASGALLDQVTSLVMQQLGSQQATLAQIDPGGSGVRELVQIVGQFMLETLRNAMVKQIVIWAGLSVLAWAVRRATQEGKTYQNNPNNPNNLKQDRPRDAR